MTTSPEIKNLITALHAFQGDMKPIKKGAVNPFFKSKYADLSSILEAIQPLMTKHDLAISQFPCGAGGLRTILMHTSGEFIEDVVDMPSVDNKPQSVGSALTYARRYGISAVLGLATEDDDGNAANAKIVNSVKPISTEPDWSEPIINEFVPDDQIPAEIQQPTFESTCPCGGTYKVKKSIHGNFLGCSNYPTCKRTRKI